jgi:hypothetical protein
MAAKAKNVRTKVVTTEVEEGGGNDEILPQAGEDSAEVDAITTLLALDDSDGIRYRVHRQPSKPGERIALCQDYSRDELSFETIRATFGGGTYRITALNAQNQYVSSKQIAIAELPKAPGQSSAPNTDLAAILQAAKGDNSGNELLLALIKSQGDMMTALLTRPPPPPPPAGPSVMEIIQMIQAMKEDKPTAVDSGDSVKLLLQGLELGRTLGGGESGDIWSKGLDMLPTLLEKAAQQPQPSVVPINPNPQPRIAPPATTAPQAPQVETDPMLMKLNWLKRQTQNLVVQARRGKDPGLYAEVMLDNLPDYITAEEIFERLNAPDAIAQLSQLNPDIVPYAEWFERFRKAVIEFLSPDADETGGDVPSGDLEP